MEIKLKVKKLLPDYFDKASGITKKQFLKYLDKNLGDRIFFHNKLTQFGRFAGDLEITITAFSKKTIKRKL